MERDTVDVLLAQWAAQKPTVDVSPMAIVGRVFRLNTFYRKSVEAIFQQCNLTTGEFDVLATLLRAGEPHRLTVGQLVGFGMVTGGAITNRLDGLKRKGYVERLAGRRSDRRQVEIAMTPAGRAAVERALLLHVENEERLLACYSPEEQATLEALLRKGLAFLGDTVQP